MWQKRWGIEKQKFFEKFQKSISGNIRLFIHFPNETKTMAKSVPETAHLNYADNRQEKSNQLLEINEIEKVNRGLNRQG